ncbi:MAG: hypothetical protein E7436_02880 [Ruminococcaceae bacterium]|nr:hypothetical protein [Oscillospiraceae bacterium]
MSKTKWIVRVAVSVAILIGGQMALTALSGVEIVTVVLLSLCFVYGIRTGVAIATTFSLLRCFFFGFHINVLVLYLVYYNLFALFFGWLGGRFAGNMSLLKNVVVVASAVVFTAMFTLLDDVITPVISGFGANATKVYFLQSLTAMVPQCICAAVTVTALFEPLRRLLARL